MPVKLREAEALAVCPWRNTTPEAGLPMTGVVPPPVGWANQPLVPPLSVPYSLLIPGLARSPSSFRPAASSTTDNWPRTVMGQVTPPPVANTGSTQLICATGVDQVGELIGAPAKKWLLSQVMLPEVGFVTE